MSYQDMGKLKGMGGEEKGDFDFLEKKKDIFWEKKRSLRAKKERREEKRVLAKTLYFQEDYGNSCIQKRIKTKI